MQQAGQILRLRSRGPSGEPLWAYRFRDGGREGKRVQCGGFLTLEAARFALDRELERLRRAARCGEMPTLRSFAEEYLAQHTGETETRLKLRWLLSKSLTRFGDLRLDELDPREIAAWRATVPPGHRFEATQALRQVLHRAVVWGLLEANPAKVGVENPVPRYREMRPFDSWEQLQTLALELGPRFGAIVLFAAATGLRPGEWTTLQVRDIDRDARVIHVRRALRNGRTKVTKTLLSTRTVPLQSVAAELLRDSSRRHPDALVFPAPSGSHFDLHNIRNRYWKPAQLAIGLRSRR